ncbi:hypothetical protein VP01_1931g1 [Puccinia sorghi]|uniref:Uncharacterized protein n=1 Tax=Puccinia sorghi TaxID=27349 RepID=A0A0L6VCJ2_9BASI|nr:hypothetical protein VP01_1931g1 [Puccinia sorghi]
MYMSSTLIYSATPFITFHKALGSPLLCTFPKYLKTSSNCHIPLKITFPLPTAADSSLPPPPSPLPTGQPLPATPTTADPPCRPFAAARSYSPPKHCSLFYITRHLTHPSPPSQSPTYPIPATQSHPLVPSPLVRRWPLATTPCRRKVNQIRVHCGKGHPCHTAVTSLPNLRICLNNSPASISSSGQPSEKMDALNARLDEMMRMMAKEPAQLAMEETLQQTQARLDATAGQQNPAPAQPTPTPASASNPMIGLHAINYPKRFPTDARKVVFIVSFMKDYAATCLRHPDTFITITAFALRALWNLCQTVNLSAYTQDFNQHNVERKTVSVELLEW